MKSFADLARRTFRRATKSQMDSARNKTKLAVTLLEDRTVPATVEGTIFYDANSNEIQDSGEGFAEGIGVMLSPFDGSSMFATTDANGHYAFTGVSPGSYGINVNSMPSGYTAEAINGTMVGIASDTDDVGVGFGLAGGGGGSSSGSGPPPTISVSESDTTEGVIVGSSGYFRFTRSGSTANDVTVNYTLGGTATSGTDYTALTGSVTIPSGQSSADADVTALADNLVEGNETIIATISSNSAYIVGTPSTATLTITDDPPIVSLSAIGNTTEGGAPGYVTFTRTGGDINSALSVTYSVGGSATSETDYTALSGAVSIPAGDASVNENITALRDNLVEGAEAVILTITGAGARYLTGAPSVATVTISDDALIVSLTATNVTEGSDPASITFTRTGGDPNSALTVPFQVGGTATFGTDYTPLSGTDPVSLIGSIIISAGSSSADISLTALQDDIKEGSETVTIQIAPTANYKLPGDALNLTAVSTITDNWGEPLIVDQLNKYYDQMTDLLSDPSIAGGVTSAEGDLSLMYGYSQQLMKIIDDDPEDSDWNTILQKYFSQEFDLGTRISSFQTAINKLIQVASNAVSWSEGGEFRLDGIDSMFGSTYRFISALQSEIEEDGDSLEQISEYLYKNYNGLADQNVDTDYLNLQTAYGDLGGILDSIHNALSASFDFGKTSAAGLNLIEDGDEEEGRPSLNSLEDGFSGMNDEFDDLLSTLDDMSDNNDGMIASIGNDNAFNSFYFDYGIDYIGVFIVQQNEMDKIIDASGSAIQAVNIAKEIEEYAEDEQELNNGNVDDFRMAGIASDLSGVNGYLTDTSSAINSLIDGMQMLAFNLSEAGESIMFSDPTPNQVISTYNDTLSSIDSL